MMEDGAAKTVAQLDSSMVIVTAAVGDEKAGCLVGFGSQVSIEPLRYLAALSVRNHTFRLAQQAGRLAVHVLSRENASLAELFGSETGDRTDKFAHCRWQLAGGVPVLADAAGWFAGSVIDKIPLGDHVGFLLDVDAAPAHPADVRRTLLLSDVGSITPGHPA